MRGRTLPPSKLMAAIALTEPAARQVPAGWKDMAAGMLLRVTCQRISGSPEIGVPVLPALIDSFR